MMKNIVNKFIERVDQSIVNQYSRFEVSDIDDAMGKNAAFSSDFIRFGNGRLCGSAYTVKVEPGDNLMLAAALDLADPGDVLVVDAGNETERALVGELLATYAASRGIQGMILNGAVRDVEALSNMNDFVVYGKSISPNGPYKNKPGSINIPIQINGKLINPGDLIIADSDGIISISKEDVNDILNRVMVMKNREARLLIQAKQGINPRPVNLDILKELGCTIK